jgi:hypothetical protein
MRVIAGLVLVAVLGGMGSSISMKKNADDPSMSTGQFKIFYQLSNQGPRELVVAPKDVLMKVTAANKHKFSHRIEGKKETLKVGETRKIEFTVVFEAETASIPQEYVVETDLKGWKGMKQKGKIATEGGR